MASWTTRAREEPPVLTVRAGLHVLRPLTMGGDYKEESISSSRKSRLQGTGRAACTSETLWGGGLLLASHSFCSFVLPSAWGRLA